MADRLEHVCTYRYEDAAGRLLYEVRRFRTRDGGKTFRQRRPDRERSGAWIDNLDGVDRVPYRWMWIEEHIQERPDDWLWVCEGEKDVERLTDLGLTATTSAQGTTFTWPESWSKFFEGARRIAVLADNDDVGRKAAHQRASVLYATGADIAVVELPGLPEKGDVSDWLDAGGTVEQLIDHAFEAPYWTPDLGDGDPGPTPDSVDDTPAPPRALTVRWVSTALATPPEEPDEIVRGLVRAGELAAVAAGRALGKSFWAMNLAAKVAEGEGEFMEHPEFAVVRGVRVLIAQGELDEWGTYTRWQMLTGDGTPPEGVAETFDRWRIRVTKRRSTSRGEDGQAWSDEWADAVLDPRLEATIREHGIGLLIIDPWAVYFGGSENSNDETEQALDKLRDLAMRTGCAIVIVHHISGKGGLDKLDPEDLWRGATRLADWASTRITLLPHYKREGDWKKAGKTRQQARRYVDVHVLRRNGAAIEDFSIEWSLDPGTKGWWRRWDVPAASHDEDESTTPTRYNPVDVADLLRKAGGEWPSKAEAARSLGMSVNGVNPSLRAALNSGLIEQFQNGRATGYRLPGTGAPTLRLVPNEPEAPDPEMPERQPLGDDLDDNEET